jgi:hypothetical protein
MSIDHLLLSQLYYSFGEKYVIISRMIGILMSEFLTVEIGFKILNRG